MAISTPRDNNRIPTIVGTSNVDGVTPVSVAVNPTNHGVKVDDGTTGSGFSYSTAQRDANRVPAMWAVSSADGVTPVPIYVSGTGSLLVNSH